MKARILMVVPVVVAAAFAASAGVASAQTTFQATISGINQKPNPPCVPTITSPTAVFCGSATIAGYGPAVWTGNIITPFSSPGCFDYEATTTFVLLSDDSTLVLDEKGLGCTPGNSSSNPSHGFGFPIYANNSSWQVVGASGQFASPDVSGCTSDSPCPGGTDTVRKDGARVSGTYTGTLGN